MTWLIVVLILGALPFNSVSYTVLNQLHTDTLQHIYRTISNRIEWSSLKGHISSTCFWSSTGLFIWKGYKAYWVSMFILEEQQPMGTLQHQSWDFVTLRGQWARSMLRGSPWSQHVFEKVINISNISILVSGVNILGNAAESKGWQNNRRCCFTLSWLIVLYLRATAV